MALKGGDGTLRVPVLEAAQLSPIRAELPDPFPTARTTGLAGPSPSAPDAPSFPGKEKNGRPSRPRDHLPSRSHVLRGAGGCLPFPDSASDSRQEYLCFLELRLLFLPFFPPPFSLLIPPPPFLLVPYLRAAAEGAERRHLPPPPPGRGAARDGRGVATRSTATANPGTAPPGGQPRKR